MLRTDPSWKPSDAITLKHGAIDLDTEPRAGRNRYPSFHMLQRFFDEMLPERMRGPVVFQDRLCCENTVVRGRNRRDELQRRGLGDRGAPHMWIHLYAVRLRQCEDVPRSRDPAAGTQVRLGNVDAAPAEKFSKTKQGVLVLSPPAIGIRSRLRTSR